MNHEALTDQIRAGPAANLLDRRSHLVVTRIDALRQAVWKVRARRGGRRYAFPPYT